MYKKILIVNYQFRGIMKKINNVISMPIKSKISDDEINSLFLGLSRLIKRQAIEEASGAVLQERERLIKMINEKNKQITLLNKEIEMLKTPRIVQSRNQKLKEYVEKLKERHAKNIAQKNC